MKKVFSHFVLLTLTVALFAGCNSKPSFVLPTLAPTPAEAPAITETVEPTAEPTASVSVEPTAEPTASVSVEPTAEPTASVSVEPTAEPTASVSAEPTAEPTASVSVEPTAELTVTVSAEPTAEPTVAPTATPTPEPTATPVPTEAPAKTTALTYDFHDMAYLTSYGTDYTVQSDGSIALRYEGIYQEIKLSLPEGVNMKYCNRVTLKAKSDYAPISFKLYDETVLSDPYCGEIAVKYDCMGDGIVEYELLPELNTTVAGIGIMANGAQDTYSYSNYKATVYSITFHLDADYTAAPTPTPFIPNSTDGATLLNTYGSVFGYMGTCINLSQLQNSSTLAQVKSQYNSVSLENEMKPDAVLSTWSPSFISVAEAKQLGYVIPDTYKESIVPKLNFTTIDRALAICAENGLSMRAHTLVWHSQTPNWFFRTGYSSSGGFVKESVMDARMEFYIRTVMAHVHGGEYSDVIYSWDIVNEYLHADDTNWKAVYGDEGLRPSFVKKAYEIADDVLRSYGIRDKVTLIFNDYNTYMEVNELLSIVDYINSDGDYCDAIGMQAHLDTGYPSPSLFRNTVQSFLDAGLEVQITELDVTNTSASEQADYLYELMSYLLEIKKNGGNITGLTYWGVADDVSWRRSQSPLLFSTLTSPKKSYYSVLDAYVDAGLKVEQ